MKIPAWFKSDGATWAPDYVWGVGDLRPAARLHDWMYERGGGSKERAKADAIFRMKIQRLGRGRTWPGRLWVGAIAWIYWAGVRIGGWWGWRRQRDQLSPS